MKSASLAAVQELRHLDPNSSARPGDIVVHEWKLGKSAAFDVTVVSPLCSSNIR
ncbi:MAG: hypothetical protein GY928_09180 [Colwellia sp.]|nr:hypothetical protein [Colwellia sp.]